MGVVLGINCGSLVPTLSSGAVVFLVLVFVYLCISIGRSNRFFLGDVKVSLLYLAFITYFL